LKMQLQIWKWWLIISILICQRRWLTNQVNRLIW
jgi:hypothetical protein